MVTHYAKPIRRYVVTHGVTDYDVQDATVKAEGWRRENAVDTAQLVIADENADYYSNKVASGDELKIYWDYSDRPGASDPPTQLIFDGYIDDVKPFLSSGGILLNVDARQVGRSVLMTRCGEEYGGESPHDDLDTIKEMLTDAGNGIIPKWVNKLLGTATDTGYSLGYTFGGTDYIAAITGNIPYVYFPYKPVKDAIDDLLDIVQAIKGSNAGPHWIITPTNYFCLATIGNHEAGPANLWPTWWNTDQANSTLVQGVDFQHHTFLERPKEANYILYHGRFLKPVNEVWTESGDNNNGGSALWTSSVAVTVSDDAANKKVGADSIKLHTNDEPIVANAYAYVPTAQNWEIDHWGGQYNKPVLTFDLRYSGNTTAIYLRLYSGANYYEANVFAPLSSGVWRHYTLPVGPYWDEEKDEATPSWTQTGAPTWNDIDYIQFNCPCQALMTGDVWVDDLHFEGWILRGARQAAAYSATDPAKIKLITDDMAKDDSGKTSDTSGAIAKLAYAHLLREKSSPIQGTIVIPAQPSIMAGQLAHIHASKYSGGYRIDANMRVTQHHMVFTDAGFMSDISLTSDVLNSRPLPPRDQYNLLLKATAPEFQTRQVGSIKTRDLDITQPIMENSY